MSMETVYVQMYAFRCDHLGCRRTSPESLEVTGAYDLAAEEGWAPDEDGERVYCPAHAADADVTDEGDDEGAA